LKLDLRSSIYKCANRSLHDANHYLNLLPRKWFANSTS